jgi:hypothetical protein
METTKITMHQLDKQLEKWKKHQMPVEKGQKVAEQEVQEAARRKV